MQSNLKVKIKFLHYSRSHYCRCLWVFATVQHMAFLLIFSCSYFGCCPPPPPPPPLSPLPSPVWSGDRKENHHRIYLIISHYTQFSLTDKETKLRSRHWMPPLCRHTRDSCDHLNDQLECLTASFYKRVQLKDQQANRCKNNVSSD